MTYVVSVSTSAWSLVVTQISPLSRVSCPALNIHVDKWELSHISLQLQPAVSCVVMLPPAGKQVTLLLFYYFTTNENADLTKYDAPDRLQLLHY